MDKKNRCQSCGLMLAAGLCGSNSNGTICDEYCKGCFKSGKFTEPKLTLGDMIQREVQKSVRELAMPYERALGLATETLPSLKRWRPGGDGK